jgi:L-ribulose-5-phosphate 3-epimerase
MPLYTRRDFLKASAAGAAAVAALPSVFSAPARAEGTPLFKVSLAQWSLHRAFFGKEGVQKLDPTDFAKIAKQTYGIENIEYVNQFYADKKGDDAYLAELKKRADGEGVRSVLIMCDHEGRLGDPDEAKRKLSVENHYRWVDWAKFLGCHSIRVNAASEGAYDEQIKLAADGLSRLNEYGAKNQIGVIVENHGGLSSNGEWLSKVMKTVNHPNCGTLPDFGNFNISKTEKYDRYKGVTEMMPFAKGVSAKTHDFNPDGEESETDYHKMMKIVFDAGYHNFVGIEYEGGKLSEHDGIVATQKLLAKIMAENSK